MNWFHVPVLTRKRIFLAFAFAIATDTIQLALGPIGWTFFDEILDAITMVLTSLLIGFHPLLLPTFALELIPIVDMLPTWTGCIALVVALRKNQTPPEEKPPTTSESSDYIDV